MRRIPWSGRGQWLKADTHIHTTFSDGKHSVREVATRAVEHGCDVIAVTDHADHGLDAATAAYEQSIENARLAFPELIILAGLEWNTPPWGGDVHMSVLVPPGPDEFDVLREFKRRFDDSQPTQLDRESAATALRWLAEHGSRDGIQPVVLYNHPSRELDETEKIVSRLADWRAVNDLVTGFSGAPGHQRGKPCGAYADGVATVARWDPATRPGDAWDTLLERGHDVWAARAPSDFHNTNGDYWPGQFSETWLNVPERSARGVLRALRAGSFYGVHGRIARNVRLTVKAHGLDRRAHVGETIEVPAGTLVTVELACTIPRRDWNDELNWIDTVELIAITDKGTRRLGAKGIRTQDVVLRRTLEVPVGGLVLRGRGRRRVPGSAALQFCTNPVRIRTTHGFVPWDFAEAASWRRLAGLVVLILAGGGLAAVARGRRRSERPRAESRSSSPARPGRGHYLMAVLGFAFVAAYGSLVPFRFVEVEFDSALSSFTAELLRFGNWASGGPLSTWHADSAIHLLLFVPVAFCAMGALLADRPGGQRTLVAGVGVGFACVLLSLALEFVQTWIPSRVPSGSDTLAQLGGIGAGIFLWVCYGARVTASLRSFVASRRPNERIDWLLRAYLAGLVVYSLFPFDATFDPADFYHQFQAGQIRPIPFEQRSLHAATVWELLFDALVYVPVGMLAGRLLTKPARPVRPLGESVLLGSLLVASIEFCQLFVMSRFTETTDIITGTVGIATGAVLLQQRGRTLDGISAQEGFSPVVKWLGVALSYAVSLVVFFWWPFEVLDDAGLIQQRWEGYLAVPFRGLQRNSTTSAVSQLVYKTLLFVPLGLFLGRTVVALGFGGRLRHTAIAMVAVAGAGFAVLIELVQSALPPHVPSVTDSILYATGYLLGIGIVVMLLRCPAEDLRGPESVRRPSV